MEVNLNSNGIMGYDNLNGNQIEIRMEILVMEIKMGIKMEIRMEILIMENKWKTKRGILVMVIKIEIKMEIRMGILVMAIRKKGSYLSEIEVK
jgi:hypothetical protein